jgi:excisionase family DNA binding protein
LKRSEKVKVKPLVLTIPETAELLGISRNSCYVQVKAGTIPHLKLGRRLMVSKAQLDRLLGVEPANGRNVAASR